MRTIFVRKDLRAQLNQKCHEMSSKLWLKFLLKTWFPEVHLYEESSRIKFPFNLSSNFEQQLEKFYLPFEGGVQHDCTISRPKVRNGLLPFELLKWIKFCLQFFCIIPTNAELFSLSFPREHCHPPDFLCQRIENFYYSLKMYKNCFVTLTLHSIQHSIRIPGKHYSALIEWN